MVARPKTKSEKKQACEFCLHPAHGKGLRCNDNYDGSGPCECLGIESSGVIEPNESDLSADRAEGEGIFGKLENVPADPDDPNPMTISLHTSDPQVTLQEMSSGYPRQSVGWDAASVTWDSLPGLVFELPPLESPSSRLRTLGRELANLRAMYDNTMEMILVLQEEEYSLQGKAADMRDEIEALTAKIDDIARPGLSAPRVPQVGDRMIVTLHGSQGGRFVSPGGPDEQQAPRMIKDTPQAEGAEEEIDPEEIKE